ncbi:MAG: hypothetical protein JWQ57_1545 [Mucilaginibacter sp.]|nr:hypothetical protein [Mucilaginibacter sp.]
MDKCVFTVANGKKYRNFAYTLARSYRYHNSLNIPFFILSDEDFDLPTDLKWVKKQIVPKDLMGRGMEYRLNFYKISPAYQSLFIDSDSIIYKDISPLFDLAKTSINVIGLKITNGIWADLNPEQALLQFNIPYLIRFGGAFYFITKNAITEKICETAQSLAKSGYPFQQYKFGNVSDEPVLSISMVKHHVEPIIDNGNLWTDVAQLETHKDLNVLKGIAKFTNSSNKTVQKPWLPMGNYSPMIVHMGGAIYNKNPWLFDSARLKLYYKMGLSSTISDGIANIFVKGPYFLLKAIRNLFS